MDIVQNSQKNETRIFLGMVVVFKDNKSALANEIVFRLAPGGKPFPVKVILDY